jgi:hypothetical protein
MHYRIWISRPATEKLSQRALWIVGVSLTLWVAAACGFAMVERDNLSAAQSTLSGARIEYTKTFQALPEKRKSILNDFRLSLATPAGAGGREFASEISEAATGHHLELEALRLDTASTLLVVAAPGALKSTPEVNSTPGGSDWKSESFECRLTGRYPAIASFLMTLSSSHRIIDYSSVQIVHVDSNASEASDPNLQLTLAGTFSGVDEKK